MTYYKDFGLDLSKPVYKSVDDFGDIAYTNNPAGDEYGSWYYFEIDKTEAEQIEAKATQLIEGL